MSCWAKVYCMPARVCVHDCHQDLPSPSCAIKGFRVHAVLTTWRTFAGSRKLALEHTNVSCSVAVQVARRGQETHIDLHFGTVSYVVVWPRAGGREFKSQANSTASPLVRLPALCCFLQYVGLVVAHRPSSMQSVSQGRILNIFTCCNMKTEVADQTYHLI